MFQEDSGLGGKGGERGEKGGAMRAYQKWFWRNSIFSCDHRWSRTRRMRSFLFCDNSSSLSCRLLIICEAQKIFLYLTRNNKLSRQFLLSWFGFEIEELPHNHPNTSFPPTHNIYTIIHYYTLLYTNIHYYTLLYTIIHYYTLLYTMIHYDTLWYTMIHYDTLLLYYTTILFDRRRPHR